LTLLVLSLATVAVAPIPARAEVADAPNLIAGLGDRTLAILRETRPGSSSRYDRFSDLIAEKFDVPLIARFVTGRFWEAATDADRQRFTEAFGNYVTELFSARFAHYSQQTLAILGQRAEADGTTTVSSAVVDPNAAQGDSVAWRVAKRDDGLRIIDVSVSGVSVAQAKREEFGSILQRRGGSISALAELLESRSVNPSQAAKKSD
jgi:phospholipid transport system substrate-binding protein